MEAGRGRVLREIVETREYESPIKVFVTMWHWNPELTGEKEVFTGQICEIPWTLIDVPVSYYIQNKEVLEVYLI